MITALVIFIITYLFIGQRKIPRLHIDRLVCAALMVVAVLAIEVKLVSGAEAIASEKPNQYLSVTITPSDPRSAPRIFNIVLICDTDETRTQGLQGFRQLRTNEAALFVFQEPEVVPFWMGSVAYPIDIVFVGLDKKIFRVYPDCRPGSKEIYASEEKTAWVIETAAGSGIRVGDGVEIEGSRGQDRGKKP